MGLENNFIPSSDISVSSQKNPEQTVDSIRMNNAKLWVAASTDLLPWVEIRFSPGRNLFILISSEKRKTTIL